MKKLFRVTYVEDNFPFTSREIYVICNGMPSYKQVLKRINMLDYCGHEMSGEHYKEFIIDNGNYTKYNIEEVEDLRFIEFEN